MSTQNEIIAERHLQVPRLGLYASSRSERRYTFTLPVIVLGLDGGGRVFWEVISTLNVSWHGCMLHLGARPRGHLLLALQLVPRNSAVPCGQHALYEIIWTRENNAGWDVGARALRDENLLAMAFGRQK